MLIGIVGCQSICAQSLTYEQEKEIKEQAKKDAKKEAKRLTKEKWVYSGSGSLETALYNYYVKTADGQALAASPQTVTDAYSVSRGESMARSAAETDFAREIRVALAGKIATHQGEADEIEIADIERRLAAELKGDILKSFSLYKQVGSKNYTVRVYFTRPNLDSPASSSRISRAIDDELELAKKIGDRATGE